MTHEHAKLRISSILSDVLKRSNPKYLFKDSCGEFVRWGVVESDLHGVINDLKNSNQQASASGSSKSKNEASHDST